MSEFIIKSEKISYLTNQRLYDTFSDVVIFSSYFQRRSLLLTHLPLAQGFMPNFPILFGLSKKG